MPAGPWRMPGWTVAPPAPKPGTVPLRPLDTGDIIRAVFATVRRYADSLYRPVLLVALGCAGVFCGCFALAYAQVGPVPAAGPMTDQQLTGLTVAAAILLVLLFLLSVVATAVTSAVSAVVLRHAAPGRQLTPRQSWAQSRGRLWPVLGVQALVLGAALGILAGSLLPSVLLFFLAGPVPAAWGLLLLIPGLAGALYVGVRLILAVPVLVLEERRPVAAARRAWQLNRAAWWRSLGIPYVVGLIGNVAVRSGMTLLAAAVSRLLPVDAFDSGTDGSRAWLSAWLSVGSLTTLVAVFALVAAVLMTVRAPLAPLTYGVLYLDRRLRMENLGPTLAAAASHPVTYDR
ncbi:hypothetical protein LN042_11920 [Kitasatospora sp. RB6PN24]|uniref:hypothetical protein n=1 Tax=Kitasatospora humi TaxID=2893891 RepID=UPI001E4FB777|nr:hypothetical protein [Kitasatospora humi]MCC9307792.1 hypothetical protein [Kitasatospora humi]